jgi:MFS transporter, putative metabolite:H+ symporter
MKNATIASRLNKLPVTSVHRRIVIVVGLGLFFDLFDVFLAGVLSTVLTASFGLSQQTLPLVLGSSFLGMFIGASSMGGIADRRGRRPAFLINLGIYSLFTLLGAFSINATMLVLTRFLAGIGIGAEMPLSDAYLCELLPAQHRGRMMSWAYTTGFLGVPAAGLLARVLVPLNSLGVAGWRWLFVAGSLGAVIVWSLRRLLPESPRWLESVGRLDEATAIANQIADGAVVIQPGASPAQFSKAEPAGYEKLFEPEHRKTTLMFCVFQIFQTVGYYGFGTIVPLVLAAKGFSVLSSLTYVTIAFFGYPIGAALAVPIVERMERRRLIVGAAFLMAVFGLGVGYATTPGALMALGFAYTVTSNIFSNGFHILQGEVFPTALRARAAGSVYGLSRLSSAAMPFVLLPVLQRYGPGVMFGLIALAMGIVIVDIGFFAPATTGRALEDIVGASTDVL